MPVYKVKVGDRESPRVVEAKTPGAARAHVARTELVVTKIDTAEAFRLAGSGITLETAGDDAEDEAKPESTGE